MDTTWSGRKTDRMDDRAITDGLQELAAMLGQGCRKHHNGGDQGLASGVERHPKSSTDIDSNLGLSAQSRGTFGPIAGVGYGSLTDAQKQEKPSSVSQNY
jgi:hypothetical protein